MHVHGVVTIAGIEKSRYGPRLNIAGISNRFASVSSFQNRRENFMLDREGEKASMLSRLDKMFLVVDENIPFAREAFSHLGSVTVLPAQKMTPATLRNAQTLITRSNTTVNADLLTATDVRFVGTATTGVDHVDQRYLAERRIGFAAALGCNANSVAEYVLTALLTTAHRRGISLTGHTIGVIGAGRIGSLVADNVQALGMEPILNDPPLARETGSPHYRSITEALRADVVTLHVPLTVDGPDPTLHLIGEHELSRMSPSAVLINAARGEVVDTNALLRALTRRTLGGAVLDVWEGEPSIRWDLFRQALIGTPHVAGHSYDGKVNGTVMMYHACCRFWGIEPTWAPPTTLPSTANPAPERSPQPEFHATDKDLQTLAYDVTTALYDLAGDHRRMKHVLTLPETTRPRAFERLRRDYPPRREFANTPIVIKDGRTHVLRQLNALGINARDATSFNERGVDTV